MSKSARDIITGPGIYRQRAGGLAEVVYQRGPRWYGHWLYSDGRVGHACEWNATGHSGAIKHCPMALDIVAPASKTEVASVRRSQRKAVTHG